MKILVYTRTPPDDDLRISLEARYRAVDDRLLFREATAHADGDLESCDLVVVDDDFPYVADDYRGAGFNVERFDRQEAVVDEPPEPEGPSSALDPDDFASPTAYDAAVAGELSPDDLEGREPAGKTGYTTAQVRDLVT